MSERVLRVHDFIAHVDIYVPDEQGEWVSPIPRGLLLSIHRQDNGEPLDREVGYVAVESGAILDHPLAWLRVVGSDNKQPSPPKSPAEEYREREARRAEERAAMPRPRRRRAPRKAAA